MAPRRLLVDLATPLRLREPGCTPRGVSRLESAWSQGMLGEEAKELAGPQRESGSGPHCAKEQSDVMPAVAAADTRPAEPAAKPSRVPSSSVDSAEPPPPMIDPSAASRSPSSPLPPPPRVEEASTVRITVQPKDVAGPLKRYAYKGGNITKENKQESPRCTTALPEEQHTCGGGDVGKQQGQDTRAIAREHLCDSAKEDRLTDLLSKECFPPCDSVTMRRQWTSESQLAQEKGAVSKKQCLAQWWTRVCKSRVAEPQAAAAVSNAEPHARTAPSPQDVAEPIVTTPAVAPTTFQSSSAPSPEEAAVLDPRASVPADREAAAAGSSADAAGSGAVARVPPVAALRSQLRSEAEARRRRAEAQRQLIQAHQAAADSLATSVALATGVGAWPGAASEAEPERRCWSAPVLGSTSLSINLQRELAEALAAKEEAEEDARRLQARCTQLETELAALRCAECGGRLTANVHAA